MNYIRNYTGWNQVNEATDPQSKLDFKTDGDRTNHKMAKHYITKNSGSQKEVISAIKSSGKSLGLSDNQIAAIIGNVGRENGFKWKVISKNHTDPKNSAVNIGIISWQGSRKDNLINKLKKKGLYKEGSGITGGIKDVIATMMHHIKDEMNTGKYGVSSFNNFKSKSSTKEAADSLYKYIKYSMGRYNSPDEYFHAWKNHMWADAVKSVGLITYT